MTYQPTYTNSNRFQTIPGVTPTYDANGNLTYDGVHNYSWDAEGRLVGIDSITVTYDAFDPATEMSNGTYSQFVYAPSGEKLAIMNGQSLQKAFVPTRVGATAVYSTSGLSCYRHRDWLGSSRFGSTTGRAMYADTAYAPFGEPYAQAGARDYSFAGQNQDTVQDLNSRLYDFLFRRMSPTQGRWISPDPAGINAVDLANPQSLNRYAYVADRPTSYTDPLGLLMSEDDSAMGGEGFGVWCDSFFEDFYCPEGGGFSTIFLPLPPIFIFLRRRRVWVDSPNSSSKAPARLYRLWACTLPHHRYRAASST